MTQTRILVADKLSDDGILHLKETPSFVVDVKTGLSAHDLEATIADYHAILVRSSTQVTENLINKGKQLKLIGRAGIGVDNVDVPAAKNANIVVMNTPQGNIITTAEHAIALMFSLARHIPQACATLKSGKWEKSAFTGTEIFEKTLGVIGLGQIGSIVANRAKGLGMRVIAYDPVISQDKAASLGVTLHTLDELLSMSHFISVHVPLLPQTRYLLNANAFSKMKKGVYLVHAARGGIVDERALYSALQEDIVAGAALDVFEEEPIPANHPLLDHPRVIVTPHLGAATKEAQARVGLQLAEQVRDYFVNGIAKNVL